MNSQGLVFKISGSPPRRSSLNICPQEQRRNSWDEKKKEREDPDKKKEGWAKV